MLYQCVSRRRLRSAGSIKEATSPATHILWSSPTTRKFLSAKMPPLTYNIATIPDRDSNSIYYQ